MKAATKFEELQEFFAAYFKNKEMVSYYRSFYKLNGLVLLYTALSLICGKNG